MEHRAALWVPPEGLPHVSGALCACVAWSACALFLPTARGGFLLSGLRRGTLACELLAVASGFTAQWTAAWRGPGCAAGWRDYCSLVGSVLLLTWGGMLLGLREATAGGQGAAHIARCFLFLEGRGAWQPEGCPNRPCGVVALLLPCWLLHPLVHAALLAAGRAAGLWGPASLAGLLWAAGAAPLAAHAWQLWPGASRGLRALARLCWPLSLLPAHVLGAAAAATAGLLCAAPPQGQRRPSGDGGAASDAGTESGSSSSGGGAGSRRAARVAFLADAAAAAAAAAVLLAPPQGGPAGGGPGAPLQPEQRPDARRPTPADALLLRAVAVPFAAFLGGAAVAGHGDPPGGSCRAGAGALLLGSRPLAALGRCSLEALLLQAPLHWHMGLLLPGLQESCESFVAFFLCLWLVAAACQKYVTAPLERALLSRSSPRGQPPQVGGAAGEGAAE